MKKYDAIVIGSGIGGLAAALLLGSGGKKVAVFDKNKIPGGRLTSFERDGFLMDLGVHCISQGDKGPVVQCLEMAGLENDLEFINVRPLMAFDKLPPLKFPRGLKEHLSKEDYDILMKIMANFKAMSPEEMTQLDEVPLKDFIEGYTHNEIIYACFFKLSCVYCVEPIWKMSTGEFARCLVREATSHSSGYAQGGCIAIVNKYIDGIKRYGGEMLLGKEVDKILVKKGRAMGVLVGGEEYSADIIVSNGDIKRTVLTLVGKEHFDPTYVEYIESLEYSWSPYILRFALKQPITDLKMMSMAITRPEEFYADIRQGKVPETIPLFIVVPSNFSKDVAPPGRQYVCCAATFEPGTPDEWFERAKNTMIDCIERYIPGLRENILWMETMTMNSLDRFAFEDGSIIGIGQTYRQSGKNRPSIMSPLEGLYYVGGEAGGSGVGIELCINSAMEFYQTYISSMDQ